MTELKVLQEEMQKTFAVFKEANDKAISEAQKAGTASAETREKVEKINTDLTDLRKVQNEFLMAKEALEKRFEEVEKKISRPNIEVRSEIENRAQVMTDLRTMVKFLYRAPLNDVEQRALSNISDKSGGYALPVQLQRELLSKAYNAEAIRPYASIERTGRDTVTYIKMSRPTVAWSNANLDYTEQTLTEGIETITIETMRGLVLMHNNQIDDSDFDLYSAIVDKFSMAISDSEDQKFAIGSGVNEPYGIISDSRVQANYTNSGSSTTLASFDPFYTAAYKLKKFYRVRGTWAMNSSTEAVVRTLKDENKLYLWQPSIAADRPPTINGRPIMNPEYMPDIAAGTFPVVFGDFTNYKIFDHTSGLTVTRASELYLEKDCVGMFVKKRVGAKVIMPEAFQCIKIAS